MPVEPRKRTTRWVGHNRVVTLLPQAVDRAMEIECAKRDISKRRFVEESVCKELGIKPPHGATQRGVKMDAEPAA